MQHSAYNIEKLIDYLLKKHKGYTDPQMEQKIQDDAFLHMVALGVEKIIREYGEEKIGAFLYERKIENWNKLTPSVHTIQRNTASAFLQNFTEVLKRYFLLKNYDPQYLPVHMLFGFNFSCIALILMGTCFLNCQYDASSLSAYLEVLIKYKAWG